MTEQSTAVTVQGNTGMMSLKGVTDRVNLVHQVLDKIMVRDTHYGTVPGCGNKQVLLKPGADLLAMTFRLVPQFAVSRNDMENGHREYDVTCSMHGADGVLLGQGVGSASTMEKKYRYRKGPKGEKIENEDIADVYNTVLKIAKKRAHIDATLTVTGAADLFTQDLIEEDDIKAPIKAPQSKQPPVAGESTKTNADDHGAPAENPQLTSANEFRGVLADVSEKHGKGKKGDWTRYGLVMESGEMFGTFSSTIAEIAIPLIGGNVIVTFEDDGKFKTVTGISPVTE